MTGNDGIKSAGSSHDHVSVEMFTPIAVPVLRSVDAPVVSKFLKDYEQYELEVAFKKGGPCSLQVASYSASIERRLLKKSYFHGVV